MSAGTSPSVGMMMLASFRSGSAPEGTCSTPGALPWCMLGYIFFRGAPQAIVLLLRVRLCYSFSISLVFQNAESARCARMLWKEDFFSAVTNQDSLDQNFAC